MIVYRGDALYKTAAFPQFFHVLVLKKKNLTNTEECHDKRRRDQFTRKPENLPENYEFMVLASSKNTCSS